MTRPQSPCPPGTHNTISPIAHLEGATERPEKPSIDPSLPAGKERNVCNPGADTAYVATWTTEQVATSPFTELESTLPLDGMETNLGLPTTIEIRTHGNRDRESY